MKEQSKIPVSKVARAMKFVTTGAKVGGNYIKHYSKKAVNPNLDRSELHTDNASDIYGSLSELKGSALKVAQMLAMDKNILPQEYQEKFTMAQYSAPPLSYPLVVKTFQKTLGRGPSSFFDEFIQNAMQAASMGQVHKARNGNKSFAVKVQYPGVGDSVKSDLKLVKPFAIRLMNINEKELDIYFQEVEEKLLEETDYSLELRRSIEITAECRHLDGINFPTYYPELSSSRILTMDWIEGKHLKEFLKINPSQEIKNDIGQALWDFYDFQIHNLRKVHADPHPGNFIIGENGVLNVIDFGCVKEIPENFYIDYFGLLNSNLMEKDEELEETFERLNFLLPTDSNDERKLFVGLFKEMIELISRPFRTEHFDFGNDSFFNEIYSLSERISKMEEVKKANAGRGSRHGLYINRTYFGLYNLLNMLAAVNSVFDFRIFV
jgi:predicted unusual protein kinase regulating ubiquinone biosynthesis (AarF/ABC1/UbiB family)